jgi:outer membrane protein TolC
MKHQALFISIISFFLLSPVFVWASYPELSGVRGYEQPEIDKHDLAQFTDQWDVPGIETADAAARLSELVSQSPQLQQLQALYELQELNYRNSADDSGLNLSVSTDPAQTPAYRYTRTPGGTSHFFGLNTAASLDLPTGGALELRAGNRTTASYSSNWSWAQAPSFSLSVQQPLGAGENLIDVEYAAKQLENLRIARDQANLSADQLKQSLILQGLSLISVSQGLKENLWLLEERISLSEDEISRLDEDLRRGTASLSDVREKQIELEQLLLTRTELSYELEMVTLSFIQLFGDNSFDQFQLAPSADVLRDPADIFTRTDDVLEADHGYQSALLKLRELELSSSMNSLSDAPMLGVGLSYAPASGSGSSSLGSSFSDIGWDDPELAVTVSFQAPDLTRKASSLKSSADQKQIVQAEAALSVEKQRVIKNLEELKHALEKETASLGIAMQEYRLSADAYEQERIRYESGSSSRLGLKRFELDEYAAAFDVLSRMRSLDLLWYEIESLL